MQDCGQEKGAFAPLELWFEEKSPDNLYSIRCEKIIKMPPYSKQMVVVTMIKEEGGGAEYGKIKIDNKGRKLDKSNYDIEWTARGAIITFSGLGQLPVSYVIEWEKAFPNFEKELEYWEGMD